MAGITRITIGELDTRVRVTGGPYDHCIRLQCGEPWSPRIEAGLQSLGSIVTRLARTDAQARLEV